jgi:hypothetical protein
MKLLNFKMSLPAHSPLSNLNILLGAVFSNTLSTLHLKFLKYVL